jgi:hypothetical protein
MTAGAAARHSFSVHMPQFVPSAAYRPKKHASEHENPRHRDPPPGSSSQVKSRLLGSSWHTTADTEAAETVREVGPICERGPPNTRITRNVETGAAELRRPRFRSSCVWVRWWVPVCACVYRVCPGSLRCLFTGTVCASYADILFGRLAVARVGRCVGGLSVCPVFVPCPVCVPAPPVSFYRVFPGSPRSGIFRQSR